MLSMFALPDFAAMHRYFSDREIADLFVCYVREQRGPDDAFLSSLQTWLF